MEAVLRQLDRLFLGSERTSTPQNLHYLGNCCTDRIMTFFPNDSLPPMPSIPDSIPLCDFMFDERYGRRPYDESLDAYTCRLSGRKLSAHEQKERVELLSRALAKELHWRVNEGSEFDKTVGVFALNTVSTMSF